MSVKNTIFLFVEVTLRVVLILDFTIRHGCLLISCFVDEKVWVKIYELKEEGMIANCIEKESERERERVPYVECGLINIALKPRLSADICMNVTTQSNKTMQGSLQYTYTRAQESPYDNSTHIHISMYVFELHIYYINPYVSTHCKR